MPSETWKLLNDVRMFIEDQYADPAVAPDGEWLAKEARPIHDRLCTALATPPAPAGDVGEMTPEEIRLENLKQMAAYSGPIVAFDFQDPHYLASCDECGWVGSSKHCGTDSFGDDSDVYCPRCHASGADCGKVAAALSRPSTGVSEAAPENPTKGD